MNKDYFSVLDKLYKVRLAFLGVSRCCWLAQVLAVLLITELLILPAALAEGQLSLTENLPSNKSIISLWKKKRASHYISYTNKQMQLAESIFEQLLSNSLSEKSLSQLRSLNLSISKVNNLLLVSEDLPPYSGQGIYVFRVKAENEILLQAPHGYHDLKTGKIAIKMMLENSISALAINTVSRKYKTSAGVINHADMAHLPVSLFMAFSRAFAKVYGNGKIIQLHGFNAEKRAQKQSQKNTASALNIIISNGTRAANQQLILQQTCLDKALSIKTHVYPLDINELGGTKNTIGRAIRQLGFSGFKHIEMSLPVRKKLNRSKKMRRALFECMSQ